MANEIVNHESKLDNMNTLLTEHIELKEKVHLLEGVFQKMFLSVIKLEGEAKDLKTTIKSKKIIEDEAHNGELNGEEAEYKSKEVKTVRGSTQ